MLCFSFFCAFMFAGISQQWSEQDDQQQLGCGVWSKPTVGTRQCHDAECYWANQQLHQNPPGSASSGFSLSSIQSSEVCVQSLFKCETWIHSQHLTVSNIITVLLFQQQTRSQIQCTSLLYTVSVMSLLVFYFHFYFDSEIVSVFSYHQMSI